MFEDRLMPPTSDEVELTVFGLGFGEAAAVHLGGGEWLLVDSCRRGGENITLNYLRVLDVPFTAVRAIVATHWDMDHVEGLTELVQACEDAILIVSAALDVPGIRQSRCSTFDGILCGGRKTAERQPDRSELRETSGWYGRHG